MQSLSSSELSLQDVYLDKETYMAFEIILPRTEALIIAKRLVRLVDVADLMQALLDHASDTAELTVNQRAIFMKVTPLEIILDKVAEIYVEYFTITELQELETFYASGVGKKLVENTPEIMIQSMQLGELFYREAQTLADELNVIQ
jgi:hypothetical protein